MKQVIYVGMLLMLLYSAYALDVDAQVDKNSIYLDEQATFSLTISNEDDISKVVQIYTADVKWYIETEPSLTRLAPGASQTLELKLIPNVWTEPGSQRVTIYVESPAVGEKEAIQLPIYVKSFDQEIKEYNPSVEMQVEFPQEIDPKSQIPLTVYLRNRNYLDIKNLEIFVNGVLFEDYRNIPLGPLMERTETFSFKLDDQLPPQNHRLEIKINRGNLTVNNERIDFEILPYEDFKTWRDTRQQIFKSNTDYRIKNTGNIRARYELKVPTTFLVNLFSDTDPQPDDERLNADGYWIWYLDLEPGEEAYISIWTNYRPLLYAILIFVVTAIIYFLYRSPLIIKKEALITGSSEEGISEMKVLIHVRNRSQELVERITITDLIPGIASLVRETHIGTLAPAKVIRHQKKGTIIKWELEGLEPYEERIISYRIKSKIGIVGGFTFPPAKVSFEQRGNKERVVKSKKASVSIGL